MVCKWIKELGFELQFSDSSDSRIFVILSYHVPESQSLERLLAWEGGIWVWFFFNPELYKAKKKKKKSDNPSREWAEQKRMHFCLF